jgi:hypothetical protein
MQPQGQDYSNILRLRHKGRRGAPALWCLAGTGRFEALLRASQQSENSKHSRARPNKASIRSTPERAPERVPTERGFEALPSASQQSEDPKHSRARRPNKARVGMRGCRWVCQGGGDVRMGNIPTNLDPLATGRVGVSARIFIIEPGEFADHGAVCQTARADFNHGLRSLWRSSYVDLRSQQELRHASAETTSCPSRTWLSRNCVMPQHKLCHALA